MNVIGKLAVLVVFCAGAANASPFLVSGPWPLPPAQQPTTCSYQEGATVVTVPVSVNPDASVYCKWDLASISRAAHNYQVWASNVWGDSAQSPFSFSAQVPAVASGLVVTP
jgi:hypothetical protein